MTIQYFTITTPADMHHHFRQGEMLTMVAPVPAKNFGLVLAMPNTTPPITTVEQAREYKAEILRAVAQVRQGGFSPVCALYLTDNLSPDVVREGFTNGSGMTKSWVAAKLYPAGATTNSDLGVTSMQKIYPKLEVMQEIGMPLLIHGELLQHDGVELSRWDREGAFMDEIFPQVRKDFPTLKIVLEHVSTCAGIEIVLLDESGYTAATITPHHLLFTDADVSRGGVNVHANCMPIIKSPHDRKALRKAAISGDPRFFAGTDSAPHDVLTKHAACCSYGAYVAPGALEAYALVFDQERVFEEPDGVGRFEAFMSLNGPVFYGLEPSTRKITMIRDQYESAITDRFTIPSNKLLVPDTEVIALFHRDLGLVTHFPWVPGIVSEYGE